jgi:hypothetical protein
MSKPDIDKYVKVRFAYNVPFLFYFFIFSCISTDKPVKVLFTGSVKF